MIYKHLIKPLLFKTDAESAHDLALTFAGRTNQSRFLQSLASALYSGNDFGLEQKLWGLTFPNPLGGAAGVDKNGSIPFAMQALGFGFVEVGSITAKPSTGNPKPRAFRLPKDRSLINRMGLNNDGADTIVKRLKTYRKLDIPLGVNIAKTNDASIHGDAAIQDYVYSYKKAQKVADYITINISCPNTGEGKTFEDPDVLNDLLTALEPGKNDKRPTLVKFTVDLDRAGLEKLVGICENHDIAGYVATNTSSIRDGLHTDSHMLEQIGKGGLSGHGIRQRSTQVVRWLHEMLEGSKPIIGVGGIDSPEAALEKLDAGASLIQLYTGMIYEGPGLIKKIKKSLQNRNT